MFFSKKKFIISQLFITVFILSEFISLGDDAILKYLVKQSLKIKTIDADIEQYIKREGSSTEIFKGRYRADNTGRLRIDFSSPDKQIVLNRGKNLLWYYPNDKLLYHLGEAYSFSNGARNSPLEELSKDFEKNFIVNYNGKHIYAFVLMAHKYEIINKNSGLKMFIWVDSVEKTVLEKSIRDVEDREVIKEIYGGYKKIGDVYLPTRIDVFAKTENGMTRNTTFYKDIRINQSFPNRIFDFKFPVDIEHRYLNSTN